MTLGEALAHLREWHRAMSKTNRHSLHMAAIKTILRHFGEN
jgi:hypothetical protein